jgi:hypothetical protein
MKTISQIFNNREISIAIWVFVFFSLVMFNKGIRDSFLKVAKVFFEAKIFIIYFLMTVYVYFIILFLYHFNLWNVSFLKETIYWYFGVAFVALFNVNKINKEEDYFKRIFLDYLKLVAILEFATSLYSFDLIIELILVPLFIFIVLLSAVSDTQKKYHQMKKVFDAILSIIGFTVIVYTLTEIIADFSSFANESNLTTFILPPILTSIYLPFIYFFALFISYDSLFNRLKYFIKNKSDINTAKWKIFFSFHLRLRKLNRFSKEYAEISEEVDNDIVTVIKTFNDNIKRKN